MDSDCLFRSASVNHLQNCVSTNRFVRSPPTLWHRLHRLTENLERNLVATLLPKWNAASFWQTHNGFLWRLRFSRRSHFNNQNCMSLFLVPRPPSLAPFRKCMDWVMGVMSAFASNNYKLQNLVAFWRQIKILRVRTYDFPAVNNLKPNPPTQNLVSGVVKVNSDRDWGFQLCDNLRGINAHCEIADFSDRWVKRCHHSAHKHHSHQNPASHFYHSPPFCHSAVSTEWNLRAHCHVPLRVSK
ncbi:MAG: hypothetical protein N3B10_06720 [Armatimonadetes bacterium]|nr:hypothetical protein [Armatimonadota bacterium]